MAINVSYQPAANLVGPVAQQAGQGMFQQRQQDRQQTQNNMLLQSQLADRQQRLGFALDTARLGQQMQAQQVAQQQDLVRMNFAANLQAQQQQFQQAMAVQQQQNDLAFRQAAGAQQLELQRQMGFAELDQNSQMMQLRNSTQANAAWQNLQAEQRALDEALSSNYITPEQHKSLSYAHAQKIAGFNPGQYSLDGPFPQGQGMGDIWDETRSFPGVGDLTVKYTRDRNGMPKLTEDSQWYLDNIVAPQMQQKLGITKGAGAKMPEAKPLITFEQYQSAKNALREGMMREVAGIGPDGKPTSTFEYPDENMVEEAFNRDLEAWQARFGNHALQQQHAMMGINAQAAMPQQETFTGGIPDSPMPQQQMPMQAPPRPMQRGPQQPQQVDLGTITEQLAMHYRTITGSYPNVEGPKLLSSLAKRNYLMPRTLVPTSLGYLAQRYGDKLDENNVAPEDADLLRLLKIAERAYRRAA